MVLKLLTTFVVVERQFAPSWLHLKMGLLPGVSAPIFTKFTASSGQDFEAWFTLVVRIGDFLLLAYVNEYLTH